MSAYNFAPQNFEEISNAHLIFLLFMAAAVRSNCKTLELKGDTASTHSCFLELKQRFGKRCPALMRMHFMTDGPHPYSREFADALDIVLLGVTMIHRDMEILVIEQKMTTQQWVEDELDKYFGADDIPGRIMFEDMVKLLVLRLKLD